MDPDKVCVVREWPTPSCVAEVKSFLGLCSYYQLFIPSFADKHMAHCVRDSSGPHNLTIHLKNCSVLKQRHLSYGIHNLWICVGAHSIGAVLSTWCRVVYYSQALSSPEHHYCVARSEILAVVNACSRTFPPLQCIISFLY